MIEVIDTQTMSRGRLSSEELAQVLTRFIGTEHWFRHSINKKMLYTDGVKFFAENAGDSGGYWFLDKVAIEILPLVVSKKQYFVVLTIEVKEDNTANISVTDGNDHWIASYDIVYTDMQAGVWKFYLQDDIEHAVLLLPSEY